MIDIKVITYHKLSSKHKDRILTSTDVGCFYCCTIFKPVEVVKWIDEGTTALCPYCGIDSVLPYVKPSDEDLLKKMYRYWFNSHGETR